MSFVVLLRGHTVSPCQTTFFPSEKLSFFEKVPGTFGKKTARRFPLIANNTKKFF